MLQVLVKDNNIDYALKTLKRKMQREGIFKQVKIKRAYEPLSVKKARKKEEAQKRKRKIQYRFDVVL